MLKTLQVLYHLRPTIFVKCTNHILKVHTAQCAVQPGRFLGASGVQHQQLLRGLSGQPGLIRRHRLTDGKQVHLRILIEQFALGGYHIFQR